MNISLELPQGSSRPASGRLDLRLTTQSGATVGDLVDALVAAGLLLAGPATRNGLTVRVDDRPVPLDHSLDEVGCTDGAVVRVDGDGGELSSHQDARGTRSFHGHGEMRLGVAGGLDAGRWLPLPAGRHRIGRGADALVGHLTTSARHATVDVEPSGRVTVVDHGSRNGTWVDGRAVGRGQQVGEAALIRTGALLTRPASAAAPDRPSVAPGLEGRAFNRPPRPAPGPLPGPIERPGAMATGDQRKPTLPIASVIGGLAIGGVMFAMTGTLAYAALAFLTPIIGVFGAMSSRRRHGRDQRRQAVAQRRALADFATAVAEASEVVSGWQRAVHPDLAEVVRRATTPTVRLWERRLEHDDALHLVLGHATRAWEPPMQGEGKPAAGVDETLREHAWLREVPIVAPGGVIGIVGDRTAALSVARALVVQACVHHGPADLEAVLVTPDALAWDGAKWLPHLADPVTGTPRASDPVTGRRLLQDVLDARRALAGSAEAGSGPAGADGPAGPVLLAVLDGVEVCEGRDAPGRAVLRGLAGPVLGIVVAPAVDRLPASCDTVIVMEGPDGACRVTRPGEATVIPGVLASGASEETLATTARALARFDDPEAATGRDLPALAALPELFSAPPTNAANVRAAWAAQRRDGRLRTPIGAAVDGPLVIDLNADGPHALVAGTTGAGKSELLRSLVAGLAASADPDHVAFVLVDYKGGAAFDRCADLPHVAGLVTDLDDDLAERALVCLQAELHRRERLLRAQAVSDMDAYRRTPVAAAEPLPDLVVVIDEFATLAAELPDFLDSLVGIAQRGRSLGVHLVLATQRPSGVVSDDIRANTNLRIALRVQDRQDSTDVIEDGAAATLTRDQPGRAFVRLGPGNLVPMQSALVTGLARQHDVPVVVQPFGLGGAGAPFGVETPGADGAVTGGHEPSTDLDVLVAAVTEAFTAEGLRRPREPWPEALPARLPMDDFRALLQEAASGSPSVVDATSDTTITVGLADEPHHQRRAISGWDVDAGSLLLVGQLGSGTTSTLSTAVLGACGKWSPQDLHVHALDAGRGDLAPLADLPHVASVVRLGDDERVARLVRHLADEVDRRRRGGGAASARRVLLAIDDFESFATAHDHGPGVDLLDDLVRVVVEGPSVGVVTAMTIGRPGGVNSRLLSSIAQRWVHRLPDDGDGAMLGIGRGVASLPPGRLVDAATGQRIQVAQVDDLASAVADVAAAWPGIAGPAPIGRLPLVVDVDSMAPASTGPVWRLPVGVRGDRLDEAELSLHAGEHALVLGAARSGRTSVLCAVAHRAVAADNLDVVVVTPRPNDLTGLPGVRVVAEAALPGEVSRATRPTLVLVDDADQVEVAGLDVAIVSAGPDVRLVAAGRADAIRSSYGHWARGLARSRVGMLLQPDVDLDGDLFGVRVPRKAIAPAAPGRGWLVDGGQIVQCQPACATPVGIRVASSVQEVGSTA